MSDFVVVTTTRARPMSLEQRQDQIIAVTTELLLEHGRDVTSKEIAEAAGIAEGTIFRAFGDKETLIDTAVERYLDPLALRTALRAIDHDLSLEDKLERIVALMLERFHGVIRMMVAVGRQGPPPKNDESRLEFAQIIGELLAEHWQNLTIAPERIAHYVRLVALANSIPGLSQDLGFTAGELTDLIMHGVVDSSHPNKKRTS
jgi:AcrR family transcriptional regulator